MKYLRKWFKTRYRVVPQGSRYIAEYRYWWCPRWYELDREYMCSYKDNKQKLIDLCKAHMAGTFNVKEETK